MRKDQFNQNYGYLSKKVHSEVVICGYYYTEMKDHDQ